MANGEEDCREVNSQITDAVTQTNVKVVAEAPAEAVAVVYQVLGQAVSLQMQNATSAQQNLLSVAGAATARAVKDILDGKSSDEAGEATGGGEAAGPDATEGATSPNDRGDANDPGAGSGADPESRSRDRRPTPSGAASGPAETTADTP